MAAKSFDGGGLLFDFRLYRVAVQYFSAYGIKDKKKSERCLKKAGFAVYMNKVISQWRTQVCNR